MTWLNSRCGPNSALLMLSRDLPASKSCLQAQNGDWNTLASQQAMTGTGERVGMCLQFYEDFVRFKQRYLYSRRTANCVAPGAQRISQTSG